MRQNTALLSKRISVAQVEEGLQLAPRFDADGLITCVTTDAASNELLMFGYMNSDALQLSIVSGQAHYWSRSRRALWRKGATSGLTQQIIEMRVDDDQDAIWLKVQVAGNGASCHVGFRSCFYRSVTLPSAHLQFVEMGKTFDPLAVYGDIPNPTQL